MTETTDLQVPDDAAVVPPEAAPAAAPAAAAPSTDPNQGIENVKAQLELERKGREEERQRAARAEAEAEAARREAGAAKSETQTTQLHLLNTAISNVTQQLDMAETSYAQALEAGDHKAAAKIQREMSKKAAELIQLEAGKQNLEQAAKNPPPPRRAPDPVEEFISRVNPNAHRSKQWLRSHPECITNASLNRKMLAAHTMALADDIQPETDAYFDFIETTLKMKPAASAPPPAAAQPIDDNPLSEAATASAGRRPPPAAPVTRVGSNGSANGRGVRLTAAQREAAEISGMSEEEYAAAFQETQKREGKLN